MTTNIEHASEPFKLADTRHIAQVQERKEAEVLQKHHSAKPATATEDAERAEAAEKIQRVFRGHRARRALDGLSLDPSTRWNEVIRDARYRQMTTPRARTTSAVAGEDDLDQDAQSRKAGEARARWQTAGHIARHAHGQGPDNKSSSSSEDDKTSTVSKSTRAFFKRQEKKEKDAWQGKMMDLPYFLEMVDLKHRYGSNLRAYHEEWKKANTHENFFYWLDHGEGRQVELASCSRERLDREQVRYLSREERQQYLVIFDKDGKLRWHKNNELLDTTEEYRDSVDGIVPQASPNKTYRQDELEAMQLRGAGQQQHEHDDSSGDSDSEAEKRYPDPPSVAKAKGPQKVVNVTPAVILNRLMRKSVKKNTWIFVVDRNMNMFVGIKQSGSFQHSSFIQGSRVTSAGLIKIKNGQIRSLAPLSGHYRPPAAAFKAFLAHLKANNVDLSHVSISKSYAVLVGLEAYTGTRKKVKELGKGMKAEAEKAKAGSGAADSTGGKQSTIPDRTKAV